ncbi:MAG: hypothetical protein AB8G11_21485 [Saprospiraceae bacterium]
MKNKIIYAVLYGLLLYSIQILYSWFKLKSLGLAIEANSILTLGIYILGGFGYLYITQKWLGEKSPDGKIE